jgi:hypothetical protein
VPTAWIERAAISTAGHIHNSDKSINTPDCSRNLMWEQVSSRNVLHDNTSIGICILKFDLQYTCLPNAFFWKIFFNIRLLTM